MVVLSIDTRLLWLYLPNDERYTPPPVFVAVLPLIVLALSSRLPSVDRPPPALALESQTAWRSEPAPVSALVLPVKVFACAAGATASAAAPIAPAASWRRRRSTAERCSRATRRAWARLMDRGDISPRLSRWI